MYKLLSKKAANLFLFLIISLVSVPVVKAAVSAVMATPAAQRVDIQAYITELVEKHGFNRTKLERLFSQVKIRQSVLQSISNPYEAKPWGTYRKLFLQPKRVAEGVQFWQKNREALSKAEKSFGVPSSVIVAIIGVESFYGKHQGTYPVMDSLTTLAFEYPARAKFFKKELTQFLLLTRKEQINPLTVKGSYAGAMGQPQFMPSSYRHYAIDFAGNGHINLFTNNKDVIGSIANYLRENGWSPEQPIAEPARVKGKAYESIENTKRSTPYNLATLANYGVLPTAAPATNIKANLIDLGTESSPEFWLGFHNFYVITRYNTSVLYAMAVYQLSQAIQTQYLAQRETVVKAIDKA